MRRGALVLLEGVDRCGKSTQCAKLVSALNSMPGHKATLMRFPDRETTIGRMISGYLREENQLDDHVVHLLFSANRWEKANEIRSALDAGTTVVMDRYSYSGIAFSWAKGLDLGWCATPEVGLPKPDAVFFLDLDPQVARTRGEYGEERYEKEPFQLKVREAFEKLRDSTWTVVNADQSIESLHQLLLEKVLGVLKSCSATPLRSLTPACLGL